MRFIKVRETVCDIRYCNCRCTSSNNSEQKAIYIFLGGLLEGCRYGVAIIGIHKVSIYLISMTPVSTETMQNSQMTHFLGMFQFVELSEP